MTIQKRLEVLIKNTDNIKEINEYKSILDKINCENIEDIEKEYLDFIIYKESKQKENK